MSTMKIVQHDGGAYTMHFEGIGWEFVRDLCAWSGCHAGRPESVTVIADGVEPLMIPPCESGE